MKTKCGHTNSHFSCEKAERHKGLHEERFQLRDGTLERTNWGDDGLAIWATRDRRRLKESGY